MKPWLIAFAFLGILASLASALAFMLRRPEPDTDPETEEAARARHMLQSLAMRVALSILLFVCVLLAWKLGWIRPSGLPLSG